jgi:flagellar motor switch protein FliN/FliY
MSDLNAKPEEALSAAAAQVAADAASAEDEAARADWASAVAEQNDNTREISANTAGVFPPRS